ncbi:MAG: hypothetical protein HWE12_01005 [Oceanospirillaceae bacterium]|nr:hypothetical protein [Oceanospirillaceae bacterium]
MRNMLCCLMLVLVATSNTVVADETADKLERLEKMIVALHNRLEVIEKKLSSEKAVSAISSDGYKSVSNWRKLETGMSTDDVRALLGEPLKINGGGVADWFYDNDIWHSKVTFVSGRLQAWAEPE